MGDMKIKLKREFPEIKDHMFLIALEEERRQYLLKKGIAEDEIIGGYYKFCTNLEEFFNNIG